MSMNVLNATPLETPEDLQWLRRTHCPGMPDNVRFALLYGDRAAPLKVDGWYSAAPVWGRVDFNATWDRGGEETNAIYAPVVTNAALDNTCFKAAVAMSRKRAARYGSGVHTDGVSVFSYGERFAWRGDDIDPANKPGLWLHPAALTRGHTDRKLNGVCGPLGFGMPWVKNASGLLCFKGKPHSGAAFRIGNFPGYAGTAGAPATGEAVRREEI